MLSVNDRIRELRRIMKAKKIDIYYIPNEDDHLSEEYTAGYFRCKSFISGFSGESGGVIITQKFAGLWTDGRYFTQAEKELVGALKAMLGIAAKVKLVAPKSITRSEGKAVHVIDNRKLK